MIVGVGVDAIDIPRVARLLERHPTRAVTKLFTPREMQYATARAEPVRHYAVRLAAKEAAYKALAGNDLARSIGWREIEVVMQGPGTPSLELRQSGRPGGRAQRIAHLGDDDACRPLGGGCRRTRIRPWSGR